MENGDGGAQLRQVDVIDPNKSIKDRSETTLVNDADEGSEVWRYYKSVFHI